MGRQSLIFIGGEGDEWLKRNRAKIEANKSRDPVLLAMEKYSVVGKTVLEIGCSNGWRLEIIREKYKAKCFGMDPSKEAVAEAAKLYPKINVSYGVASYIPFMEPFDLIIFGFCLYLVDRTDLFKIVNQADNRLRERGCLIINDFLSAEPYANDYAHAKGVKSFKMDYSELFIANPAYRLIGEEISGTGDDATAVQILHKNTDGGWPDRKKK